MSEPILQVNDLVVRYRTRAGTVHAVEDLSFDLAPGEILGVVGESGCGKSSAGRAIARLTPIHSGQVVLDGHDLGMLRGAALRRARSRIPMIFQDPRSSMNPRRTVRDVVAEPLRIRGVDAATRRTRADELLSSVGVDPATADRYPHEFSGGQAQRIAIARALACDPKVIICDEPVSALDVSVQAQIIALLAEVRQTHGVAMVFISHDLSVVRLLCDKVAVMYLGRVCEIGPTTEVFAQPRHHYTRALAAGVPVADPTQRDRPRIVLSGDLPSPLDPPSGCRFRTRCTAAQSDCGDVVPPLAAISDAHRVACHHRIEEDIS